METQRNCFESSIISWPYPSSSSSFSCSRRNFLIFHYSLLYVAERHVSHVGWNVKPLGIRNEPLHKWWAWCTQDNPKGCAREGVEFPTPTFPLEARACCHGHRFACLSIGIFTIRETIERSPYMVLIKTSYPFRISIWLSNIFPYVSSKSTFTVSFK